jgi:hypothetical protein
MKKFLILYFALYSLQTKATVRTVSNTPATIAQFNTIQAAIDASTSGDTIYVHGSPNNYAGFIVNEKRLTIIGPGWNPPKSLPLKANITSAVQFIGTGASGTEIQGLSLFAGANIATSGVNNIRFIRNRLFQSHFFLSPLNGGLLSGYLFEGNWFDNSTIVSGNQITLENMLFQNNIFYESGWIGSSINGFTNCVNVLFDHNLWYGPSGASRNAFDNNCRFLTFANNIFVKKNLTVNLSSSSFYNNITYNTDNDAPWLANGNFNGGGNKAGTDPQMAAQASVDSGVNDPLLDFSIASGPANNAGSDGKDIGLLYDTNGSLNWTNSRASRLPYIFSFQTNTPTTVPGGSISITVEARTNN